MAASATLGCPSMRSSSSAGATAFPRTCISSNSCQCMEQRTGSSFSKCTNLDHRFDTITNCNESLVINGANVPGSQESTLNIRLSCFGWPAKVTHRDLGTVDPDLIFELHLLVSHRLKVQSAVASLLGYSPLQVGRVPHPCQSLGRLCANRSLGQSCPPW